jgi:type III secretion protein V
MKVPAIAPPRSFDMLRPKRYSDIVLAFGIVAIVALMILPLPLLAIDALVAVNILFGVSLLLLAIYIPTPTAFSSFPGVLLLTTLFRLSLSIAITRRILLDADAGHIIDTFGNLVAGGNLVVGLVVFLIITVVQFIVIAKGAERVAEVAARFTLDAMPGKQLSIDSDLRSGLIDKDEARRRRRLLETESQLHGALDGAMKFVKGDAIAGIVIIIVNILGGLAVGVLQQGLALPAAVQTYSILTIGDGMVAQIPALLSSIAAGLIVTRTVSDEHESDLGAAIARQTSRHPRVLLIGGVLALLLATVPGFPWPVFLLFGALLLAGFAWRSRLQLGPLKRIVPAPEPIAEKPVFSTSGDVDIEFPAPLLLKLHPGLTEAPGRACLQHCADRVVDALREEYGVPVPSVQIRVDELLPDSAYRLSAFGVCIARGRLQPGVLFVPRTEVEVAPAADAAETTSAEPGTGTAVTRLSDSAFFPDLRGHWIERDTANASPVAAGTALEADGVLALHLRGALRRHLGLFLGIQETANLVQRWSRDYPDLVKEMFRVIAPQRLSEVLRRLVDEDLPVRNLRAVFEVITEAAAREKDVVILAEQVRMGLRRHISDRYAGPERRLQALIAHPELEDQLRQSLRQTAATNQLAVDPRLPQQLVAELQAARSALGERFAQAVLLTSMDVRRHLRALLDTEFPGLPVLSFQELLGDVRVVALAQIRGAVPA